MTPLISGLASVASFLFNAAQSASGKAPIARHNGESAGAEPSTKLHLSKEAQALAGLAGQGAMFAQAVAPGGLESVGVRAGGAAAVSSEDFQALLERFGASSEQKMLLTDGFDTNKNGAISRAEFLQGLGRTARNGGADDFSQALLELMDRGKAGDANASVSKQEFAAFTTAFAAATQGRHV